MKIIIIFSIFIVKFISYSEVICGTEEVKFSMNVNLKDTIDYRTGDKSIILEIVNHSKESFFIQDPMCYGISFPCISMSGRDVPLNKITVNMNSIGEFVLIEGNSSYKTIFNLKLNQITDLKYLIEGNYVIQFKYFTDVLDMEKKLICKDIKIMSSKACFFLKK